MKVLNTRSLILLLGLVVNTQLFALDANNVIGQWKVINEKTSKPIGDVKINFHKKTGTYYGVPVKTYSKNRNLNSLCKVCPGRYKNKPLKKIPAMWNFKYDAKKKKYTGGYVMDMISGKIYRAEITPTKTGKSLRFRGSSLESKYIGRTNVWIRVK